MPIDPSELLKVRTNFTPSTSNVNLPSPGDNNYNIDYSFEDTLQTINDKKAENETLLDNTGKFLATVGMGVITAPTSTVGSLLEITKVLGSGLEAPFKDETWAELYAKREGNVFSDASKAIKDYANKYIIDPRIDSRTKWGDLEEIVNGVGGSVSEFMTSGVLTGGAGAALKIGSNAMNAVQWVNPAFMESYMGVKDNLNKHLADKEQIKRELNSKLNEIEDTIFDPIEKQKAIDQVNLTTNAKLAKYNDNDIYTGALISLGLGTAAGTLLNYLEYNPFIKGVAKSSIYDNMANAIGEAITTKQGVKEFAKKAEAGIIKSPLTDFWGAGGNTLKEMGEEGLQDMSLHIGDDYSNQKIATGDYNYGKAFESLSNMMFSDKFLKTLASGAFGGISMQLVGGAFQESGIGAKFGGAETTKKQNEDLRKMATIAIENNENFSNMAMEIDRKMFEAKKIEDLRKNGQVIEAQESASSLIHEHLQESFKKGLFQFTKNNVAELKESVKPLQEELKALKEKQQDLLASPTATESEKTTLRDEIFQKETELANIETLSQHTEGFEKKYEEYNKKTKNDDLTHLAMQLDFNERSLLESENSYRKRSEEIAIDLRQQVSKIREKSATFKPGSAEFIRNEAIADAVEKLIENPLNTEEAFTNLSNKINKGQNIIDDADLEIIAKRKPEVLSDLDTISRQMNDLKANGADIETIKPLYQQQIELSKYLNQLKGDEIAINERKADDIKELEESLRKNSSLYGALKDNHDSLVASRLAKKRRISLNEFKNKILSDKIVQQGAIDSLTKKKESIEFTKMMMTEIQLLRQNQLLLNFGHENYLEEFDKEKDLSQEMLGAIIAEEQSKKEEEQLKKRDAIKKKIDDEIALRFKNRPSIIKILEERKKLEADIKAIEDELKKLEAEAKTKTSKDAKEKLEAEKKDKEEELKKKLEAEAKAILAEKELIAKEENVNFLRSVGINVSMADSDELILNIIKYSEDLSNSFLDYFNPDGSIRNDIGATSLPAYSDAAYVISDLLFLIDELKGKGIGDVSLMLKELSQLVYKYNYTDNFDDAVGSADRIRIENLLKEFGLLVKDIAKIPRETSNLVEAEKFNEELKEAEEAKLKAEEEAKKKAEKEAKETPVQVAYNGRIYNVYLNGEIKEVQEGKEFKADFTTGQIQEITNLAKKESTKTLLSDIEAKIAEIEKERKEEYKGNVILSDIIYSVQIEGKTYEISEIIFFGSSEVHLSVKNTNGDFVYSSEVKDLLAKPQSNKKFLRDATNDEIDEEKERIDAEYDAKIKTLRNSISQNTDTTKNAVIQITEKTPEEKEAEKKVHKSPEKLDTSKLDGAKSKLFNVNVDIATMSIVELDKNGKPIVDSTGSVVVKPQIFEQHRNILRGDLIMKSEIRNNIVIGRIGLTSVNMSYQELEEVDKQMIDEKITKLSESLKTAFGEAIDFKFLSEDSFYRSLGKSKDKAETVTNAYIRDKIIYINSNGNIDESTLIHEFSHPIVILIHENIPVLYGDLLEASKKFLTEAELKEIIDLYGENYKHLNDEIIVHAIQYAFKDKNRNGSEVVKNFREGIREEIKSPIFAAVSEVTSLQSIVKLITEGDAKLKNALSSIPSSEKQKAVISKLDSEITEITNNPNNRC